ncbi:MAG: hypothetical protein ACR2OE_08280 [Thermomicrobiales bacterium]
MNEIDLPVTEAEMRALDVDLDLVWDGIAGELWATRNTPTEQTASRLLGSAALARALIITPSLVLSWLLASALVFALGGLVTYMTRTPLVPLIAPVITAIGVSFAYGAAADPAFEISRTMPTSARMIMLVRVVAVVASNALLGMVASLVSPAFSDLTMLWLLPMVAIASLGLAVATVSHSATAGSITALAVWCTIVMSLQMKSSDIAKAVEAASIATYAPLYLALALVSWLVVLWSSGEAESLKEKLGW